MSLCLLCSSDTPDDAPCKGCGAPPSLRKQAVGLGPQALMELRLQHGHAIATALRDAVEEWGELMATAMKGNP